jgi:GTP cyclohydrolase I
MDEGKLPKITLFDNSGYDDILAVKDVAFYSMCEHHLLPFSVQFQ